MKKLNTFALVFVGSLAIGFASTSFAKSAAAIAAVPNCWSESGEVLVDGNFMVRIDTKSMTKVDLLKVLDALKTTNLTPMDYPLIFGDKIFVLLAAMDYGRPALARDELKSAVGAQLATIFGMAKGVSAECNHISHASAGDVRK